MKKVLIPLAQGCEELEAITIIDLLRRAGIEVISAGLDDKPVVCSRKTVIIADTTLDQILNNSFDLIVLPGGLPGADHLRDDERIIQLLKNQHRNNKPVAAICAAPKVLAKAGLLDNITATCFPNTLNGLDLPTTTISNNAIEMDKNIITSRGPGTAMEFALTLIEALSGADKRTEITKQLVAS